MNAIILAAGVGKRLGTISNEQPKCLLEFDGQTMLYRHLDLLQHSGVSEVVICIGYKAHMIEKAISSNKAENFVRVVYNPDFKKGSIISLWTLRHELRGGDDLLLMDADMLYDYRLLERLVNARFSNCFLLDALYDGCEEAVKLCVRNGKLVEFRKQIRSDLIYDFAGESVGLFQFSSKVSARLEARTEHYLINGLHDEPYEEAIRDLLIDAPETFGFEDITGLPWIEIDFPEDVRRARTEILPKLATL